MGYGRLSDINQVIESAEYIKAEYKLKVGLYSGYDESLGGLDKPTTNQRFYIKEGVEYKDSTSMFWKKKV